MSRHVVIIANPVVDISFGIAHFPVLPAEHQDVHERLITPGGQATTLLLGARLGLNMQALGTAGVDEMGRLWQRCLVAEGVDVEQLILREERPTSLSVVLTDPAGRHVFLAFSGGGNSGPNQLPDGWLRAIKRADAVELDGWSFRSMGPELNLHALHAAKTAGIPVFFDPGPQIDQASRAWMQTMVAGSTVALLTYEEAQQLTLAQLAPAEMAEHIQRLGPELVLLKLGGEGIIVCSAEEVVFQPAFEVPVRDTTGAGDSVMAAALFSYLQGYSLEKMATLANATGAVVVQKLGAGVNAPRPQEILAVLEQAGVAFVL